MIPSNLVGLVLFLASLGPGYVFVRAAEVVAPRPARSTFFQAVEMAIVGALATTLAATFVLLLGAATGWLDVVRIFAAPRQYGLEEPVRMIVGVVASVLISYSGAWGAGKAFRRGPTKASPKAIHRPGGAGWDEVFRLLRPDSTTLYATVTLRSGDRIAGQVQAWSSSGHNRELVLIAPLVAGNPPGKLQDQFIVLREQDIEHVTGRYLSERDGQPVPPRDPAA